MPMGVYPRTKDMKTGLRNLPASTRFTIEKCRRCVNGLKAGLPLKNACGRARLPYYPTLLFLQEGEREVQVFFEDETIEDLGLKGNFYLDVQKAIATRIEERLKLYDANADGADYVKNWAREVELMKRLDPDTWNVFTKSPGVVINNNNQQANVEATALPSPVVEGVRFVPEVKSGEEWERKALPPPAENLATLDEALEKDTLSPFSRHVSPHFKAMRKPKAQRDNHA